MAAAVAGMVDQAALLFAGWEEQVLRHEGRRGSRAADPPGKKRKPRPKAMA